MPVRKFRDGSEMEDALWYERADPALHRAIASVWQFATRTCPLEFPPGVAKHRAIEEADALRERWEENNFRMFQARRLAQRSAR